MGIVAGRPKDAVEAFKTLDAMLAKDNAVAERLKLLPAPE
jgi:hypothetical protein